jgi:hypothetical protein
MTPILQQIRGFLTTREQPAREPGTTTQPEPQSAPDLRDIICDVVDLLMPELKPLDAALYIHLLRHSIIAQGSPQIRTSRAKLQGRVVKAGHAFKPNNESGTSSEALRNALARLEAIGAIRVENEPNRYGTLYRLFLPSEIKICRRRRAEGAQRLTVLPTAVEPDFYNIRLNRLKIYQRDNYRCTYCSKQLTRSTATLDHITPVSQGGDNTQTNLITACLPCNSRKSARPVGDFLAETTPT